MNQIELLPPPDSDETGASAVEYGLLVALIAAVIISIVIVLGGTVDGLFSSVCVAPINC